MLKDTRNTDNSGIRFISRFTMNNIARKLQKCWTHKIAFKIISKVLKQPNFFYSQPSTLPKEAPAKFYLSTTFGLSFMISSVAPTGSSTSSADLITKIGNHNLNPTLLIFYLLCWFFEYSSETVRSRKLKLCDFSFLCITHPFK